MERIPLLAAVFASAAVILAAAGFLLAAECNGKTKRPSPAPTPATASLVRFETFRGVNGDHYFRIVRIGSNEAMSASEGYKNKADRDSAIAIVKTCGNAETVEGKAERGK